MNEPVTPPPVPPPLPAAPLPVSPVPATPVPVQSLTYSEGGGPGRPGLVVAIAVLAIIVACFSGLSNFMFGAFSVVSYGVTRTFSAVGAKTATLSAATPAAAVDTSMTLAETSVAVNAIQPMLGLDGARSRELTRLLKAHGRDVFEFDDNTPVGAAGVGEQVLQKGPAPSPAEPAYFVTSQGRVDVFADHAVFTAAADGRKIETSAVNNTETDSGNAGPTTAPASQPSDTLSAAQIRKVMTSVKKQANQPLTPAQLTTIESQISGPNQQLVNPLSPRPVQSVYVTPGAPKGSAVTVQFDYGSVSVGPSGELTSMYSYKATVTATTATPAWTPPPQRMSALVLMGLEAGASGVLAIYLLVVGILIFRGSFNSPRLLRIYAWVKIPLAILAAALLVEVNGPSAGNLDALKWAFGLAAIGMAYPVGVLIALRSRTVREFFANPAQSV